MSELVSSEQMYDAIIRMQPVPQVLNFEIKHK